MKRSVAELLAVPPDRVHADYAGLNHAGWIHRVLVDGVDRLPEILERYEELQRLEDSWGLFSPGFVRSIGMLPMEALLDFFYSGDRAVQNILRSGGSRGEQIALLNAPLWLELAERVASDDLEGARAAQGRSRPGTRRTSPVSGARRLRTAFPPRRHRPRRCSRATGTRVSRPR